MRPSERPPPSSETLHDRDVADWLESHDHAAVLFWDETDEVCRKHRARVEVVAASAGVPLGVLDVRTDALVAQALGVKSVPTLVVFRAADVAERVIGLAPEVILREAIGAKHHPGR